MNENSQSASLAIRLREENPSGVFSGTKFLELALEHNFNAYDHFDIEGDSYVFQAWVDEDEADRYINLITELGALNTNTVDLGVLPPEEWALSHSVATDGTILLLAGKARAIAAAPMCSMIQRDTADVDFSWIIREEELRLVSDRLEEEDHDIRYPVTTEPCELCDDNYCMLYVCHRLVVMGISELFDD